MAPTATQPPEFVTRFMIAYAMAEHADMFWRNVRHVAGQFTDRAAEVKPRHVVVGTIVTLMELGRFDRLTIDMVASSLGRLSDAALKDAAVAVVNTTHLILPDEDGSAWTVLVGSLEQVEKPPPAFMTLVYSAAAIWRELDTVLTDS
jgi:hypothetical protein